MERKHADTSNRNLQAFGRFRTNKRPALRELSETVLGIVNKGLDSYLERETEAIWTNLQDSLTKQHSEMKRHHQFKIDEVNRDLTGSLKGDSKALYLASSLIKFWHPLKSRRLARGFGNPSTNLKMHKADASNPARLFRNC